MNRREEEEAHGVETINNVKIRAGLRAPKVKAGERFREGGKGPRGLS